MIVSALASVAAALVATAAALGALSLIAKSTFFGRPLRWLWRQNVGDPATRWFKASVSEVVGEHIEYLMHNPNHGSSLLDLRRALEAARDEMRGARADINLLLRHDKERDVPGHRYGHGDPSEEIEDVQNGIDLLLEHDDQRDTYDRRYGPEP